MGDVVGIIGLSIAIFDQLLKAAERADELLSAVRKFDQDAGRLQSQINGENNSNLLLKAILFDACPIYGGHTLFEQFPSDIQEEVRLNFVETENVVQECIKILEKGYATAARCPSPKASDQTDAAGASRSGASTPFSLASTSTGGSMGGSTLVGGSKSQLLLVNKPKYMERTSSWVKRGVLLSQWSLRDKKRIEVVVGRFVVLNQALHEKVKLGSFAGSLGLDIHHLQRLRQDPTSIGLGFHIGAALRLKREEDHSDDEDLEIAVNVQQWTDWVRVEDKFGTARWQGKTVLIETHAYKLHSDGSHNGVNDRTAKEVNRLACLLRQPKEHDFRVPRCLGWKNKQDQKVDFIFEIEGTDSGTPVSLLSLLKMDLKVSLNDKISLALSLAKSISQLHLVQWVHESFCSESVLFWTPPDMRENTSYFENELRFGEPWLLGFECSRPESGLSLGGYNDYHPAEDVYRHPHRQGRPECRFTKVHDIYSLGVVLLEIGLWEPALTLAQGANDKAHSGRGQKWFLKQAKQRLDKRVGKKYSEIVQKCLKGSFGVTDETKEDVVLQQAFRTQVVEVLSKILESI